jgi:hypothetical protein
MTQPEPAQRAGFGVSGVPDSASSALEVGATAEDHALRNLLLEGELMALCDALTRAGVECIVLKGVPLARRLGAALSERRIIDNDLLVHRADVPRAVEVLAGLGYASRPHANLEAALRHSFQFPLFARRHGQVLVAEIHWHAFTPALFRLPEALLWEHREPVRLNGRELLVLDPALTLLHLAAHFLQHQCEEMRILRDLSRAWNLWVRGPEPVLAQAELERLARETRLLPLLVFCLAAAAELGLIVDNPWPLPRRTRLARRLLPSSRLAQERPGGYPQLLKSLVLAHAECLPAMVAEACFPPPSLMPVIYGEPPSARLYARYLTRPLRPIWRALGREPKRGGWL